MLWIFAATLVLAGPASAQSGRPSANAGLRGGQNPVKAEPQRNAARRPWKFWIGDSRTELGITAQQAADIEQIFQSTMPTLEALKKKVDTLEAAVSQTIKDGSADVSVVTQQVDRFEAGRAELSKTRTLMLYRMRGVLTADQRIRLQAMMDRWETEHRKNPERPDRR